MNGFYNIILTVITVKCHYEWARTMIKSNCEFKVVTAIYQLHIDGQTSHVASAILDEQAWILRLYESRVSGN